LNEEKRLGHFFDGQPSALWSAQWLYPEEGNSGIFFLPGEPSFIYSDLQLFNFEFSPEQNYRRAIQSPAVEVAGQAWNLLSGFHVLLFYVDIFKGFNPLGLPPGSSAGHQVKLVGGQQSFSFSVILALSLVIIFAGHLNAVNPRIKTLSLTVDKVAAGRQELRAVMLSDIHLGMYNRSDRLAALVKKINELEPEIVFFAGDIVDEAIGAEEEEKMVRLMKDIKAPLGLFACPGNHEYYGGLEKNIGYLERAGVQELLDKAIKVDNSFYVIGRKDWTAVRFGGHRASLEDILAEGQVDSSLPLIVLDHQPIRLEDAQQAGVDLLLCGHTHAGQLFPLNLINRLIYEKNWGYLKKGQTQIYVTSGTGTWGPPVRTGSRSEIVWLTLKFKPAEVN